MMDLNFDDRLRKTSMTIHDCDPVNDEKGLTMEKCRKAIAVASIWSMAILLTALCSCSSLIKEEYKDVRKDATDLDSKWLKPQSGETIIKKDWWKQFGDPEFDVIIDTAIKDNIDLKLLVNRLDKAGVTLTGAKRDALPNFNAGIGYVDSRTMNHSRTTGTVSRSGTVGIGASWELDFWGKIKERNLAQYANYKASESDWRAGFLTLVANLSRSYVSIRQLDEQSGLHQLSLDASKEILAKLKIQLEGGVINKEDLSNQKAEIIRLTREMVELKRRRQIMVNELAFLLGKPAGSFTIPIASLRERMTLIQLPDTVQANLLERRPDIVAAELRVKKAYHLRESDRAARWPSVSVGLSGSFSSAALSTLTQSWTAAILPKINFPILDNSTKVRLKISEIEAREARENYKKTVLKAIKEVDNASINIRNRQQQLKLEKGRIKELRKALDLAMVRFKGGIISKLELRQMEREQLGAQQKGLDLYAQLINDMVDLHNALGGGW